MYIAEKKLLKWGLCCNAIYVLLFLIFRPQGINVVKVSITLLLLLSIAIFFLIALRNVRQLQKIPKATKYVFYLVIFWGVIVILRSFPFSLQDTVTNFGNVYMGWAWLLPILLLVGIKIENWKVVLSVISFIFQLMVVAFLASLLVENSYVKWAWLLRCVNLILLIGLYRFTFLKRFNVFLIIVIYIIVALIVEQRMDLLFLAMTLSLLTIDKLKQVKIKRTVLKYIIVAFLIVLTLIFTIGYEYVSNIVSSIIEFEDSRTFLFKELFEELSSTERIVGRGSLGDYYSDFFEGTRKYYEITGRVGWKGDSAIRNTIEVGYLQMILKGGYILFGLTVFMMLYASFVGVFKSKNRFTRSLGMYIMLLTILSIVSFRPTFTPTFIFMWLAIGTVLNKSNRSLSDTKIKEILNFK
jgi:hypothetical protein